MGMKVIETPKRKIDWLGKSLRLKQGALPEEAFCGLRPPKGTPMRVERRLHAQQTMNSSQDVSSWGAIRILRCVWYCRACGAPHQVYLPESWVEVGRAVFVEEKPPQAARPNGLRR